MNTDVIKMNMMSYEIVARVEEENLTTTCYDIAILADRDLSYAMEFNAYIHVETK